MKTQTKKQTIWSRSLFLIPLLALLVYGFSSKEQIERELNPDYPVEDALSYENEISKEERTARSISIELLNDGSYMIDNLKATKNTFVDVINTLHQDITPEVRNNIVNIHISSTGEIPNEEVWFIYNSLQEYGFHRIVTDNQEVVRSKGNTPVALDDKKDQKGASREQMREYNALAKKYNAMSKGEMIVKKSELERMKYIYSLMSEKQRADAEPFPKIPEPPEPPKPPKSLAKAELKAQKDAERAEYEKQKKEVIAMKKAMSDKQKAEYAVKVKEKLKYAEEKKALKVKTKESKDKNEAAIAQLKAEKLKYKEEKEDMIAAKKAHVAEVKAEKELMKAKKLKEVQEAKLAKAKRNEAAVLAEVPPPPPPPKSPLDHIVDMAKKDAVFYYEGKMISSDEAIKIVKTNKKINVSTKEADSKAPRVYISTKPIKIKSKD